MIWIPRWKSPTSEIYGLRLQSGLSMEKKGLCMTDNQERIGKILLDYSYYPGEDLYCDGQIEEELLEIARDRAQVEYPSIIEERKNWPILYHLSNQRENIVDWIPFTGTEKVLEIGSGCGAITGVLAKKAGSVTCVDLSRKRSLINAYRHQDADNVTIHVGNFQDIEPELPHDFDYICLIGVFEYGKGYIGGKTPYDDFLRIILRHLKQNGRAIIAIENKYGMKYWAGCAEDHIGKYFAGIENYKEEFSARTFSKKGLEQIFARCGVSRYSFYYPYPDYKFMTTLYSDRHLPVPGELSNNLRNYDRDRLLLFDERDAFDGVIQEGMFPEFSNSFLVVIGPDFPVQYAKFSNDRAPEFAIRTEIVEVPEKSAETAAPDASLSARSLVVRKYPLTVEAKEHVRNIASAYEKLSKRYEGSEFAINHCKLLAETGRPEEPVVELEYIAGVTLAEKLDHCLVNENMEGFHELLEHYLELVSYGEEQPVADYDLIFANVLIAGDKWNIIDYEWTFDKAFSAKELAFRALYCYILENDKRNKLNLDSIISKLDISKEEMEDYRKQELEFQHYVTGRQKSMFELYKEMHGNNLTLTELVELYRTEKNKARVQIFEDRGRGFNQEDSYWLELPELSRSEMQLDLQVDGNVRNLRLDPAEECCAVEIKQALWNGEPLSLSAKEGFLPQINGKWLHMQKGGNPCAVFDTEDPNMVFALQGLPVRGESRLELSLTFAPVSRSIAGQMITSIKRFF